MATHCDDVSARMVDLLYGELSADQRAEIDAHVAGCERCRSELEGFEKTRAVARQALDESPPTRVRAAILKAAAAHVSAQAQPTRQAAAPERVSFWDRLRVRWAFPTLATIGALAVFLVANRVFMHPEVTMQKAQEAVQPTPAPTMAPAPPAAPPVAERPFDDKVSGNAKAEAEAAPRPAPMAGERFDETAQQGARFAGREKRALEPPADRPGGAPKHVAAGSAAGYGDLSKDSAASASPRAAKPRSAAAPQKPRSISDNALDGLMDEGTSRKPAAGADNEKRYRRSETQFAPPPPPREAPAAKQRAKEMDKSLPAPAMKKTAADDLLDSFPRESSRAGGGASGPAVVGGIGGGKNKADDYGSPAAQPAPETAAKAEAPKRPAPTVASAPAPVAAPAASAPAAPAPPPAPSPTLRAHGKGGESYEAEDVPLARDADAKAEKKKKSSGKANATETLAQRADRLFSEGRWGEAAAAYRELLRQEPRNEDADRWRRRLVAAENADVGDRNASLAEKRALEAKPAKTAAPKAAKAPSKKASSVMDADQ